MFWTNQGEDENGEWADNEWGMRFRFIPKGSLHYYIEISEDGNPDHTETISKNIVNDSAFWIQEKVMTMEQIKKVLHESERKNIESFDLNGEFLCDYESCGNFVDKFNVNSDRYRLPSWQEWNYALFYSFTSGTKNVRDEREIYAGFELQDSWFIGSNNKYEWVKGECRLIENSLGKKDKYYQRAFANIYINEPHLCRVRLVSETLF